MFKEHPIKLNRYFFASPKGINLSLLIKFRVFCLLNCEINFVWYFRREQFYNSQEFCDDVKRGDLIETENLQPNTPKNFCN
jgi:hypothetical protein